MKALNGIIRLSLTILCIFSCELFYSPHDPQPYVLFLSFQDDAGHDLVKGIEFDNWWNETTPYKAGPVKSSLYTIKLESPNPCNTGKAELILYTPYSGWFDPSTEYNYLEIYPSVSSITYKKGCKYDTRITIRLKCPFIFGDDMEHEIVTYWIVNDKRSSTRIKCSRIELDGMDNTHIKGIAGSGSLATIILPRK